MIAIATTKGIVLAFSTPAEARGVAQQIIGMAEWSAENDRPGPLLYTQRDEAISAESMGQLAEALKQIPIEAVRGGE